MVNAPVKGDAGNLEQLGHILATFAILDQLPRMLDLLAGDNERVTFLAGLRGTFQVLPFVKRDVVGYRENGDAARGVAAA